MVGYSPGHETWGLTPIPQTSDMGIPSPSFPLPLADIRPADLPPATGICCSSPETCSNCSLEALYPYWYWHPVVASEKCTVGKRASYWNAILYNIVIVLGESNFWSCFRFFILDHNGKNWMKRRKRNQKLPSPSTIYVISTGKFTTAWCHSYVCKFTTAWCPNYVCKFTTAWRHNYVCTNNDDVPGSVGRRSRTSPGRGPRHGQTRTARWCYRACATCQDICRAFWWYL